MNQKVYPSKDKPGADEKAALVMVRLALRAATDARVAFEARWRMSSLKAAAPDLYDALLDQEMLLAEAMVTGSGQEVATHRDAMLRGWRAATKAMTEASSPHPAAMIGRCTGTGLVLVIAETVGAAELRRQQHGRISGRQPRR